MRPSHQYGLPHLLRFFISFGGLLREKNMPVDAIATMVSHVQHFVCFIEKKMACDFVAQGEYYDLDSDFVDAEEADSPVPSMPVGADFTGARVIF